MSSVSDGVYRLYNVATGLVMDVLYNTCKDGTNIIVYNKYTTVNDAQIFEVSTRANGTRRLQHRISGKCVDVANGIAETGRNVAIWHEHPDPDFDGQCLLFADTGNTKTIDGVSYPTFYISMSNNSNFKFDIESLAANANVSLKNVSSPTASGSNEWCFVPVPTFESGGIYEIRSYLDPARLAADVRWGDPANGTNIQLYGVNHSNAQKFFITEEETGKYSIRCLESGKYIDVAGAQVGNGVNVFIWEDNDQRQQRWKMITYGTETIDGKTCLLVKFGSYVTGDGQSYLMDVSAAQTAWETNIQIWEPTGSDAQIFALYPTEGEDGTMPVPYDFGVQSGLGDTPKKYAETSTFTIGWKCAKSWAGDGPNHYELRYRNRHMSPNFNSWNDWGDWSSWIVAPAAQDGVNAFMGDPFSDSYAWSDAKNSEWEYQVRCAGSDGYSVLHGQYIDDTINVYKVPDTDVEQASWTPDGLVLGLSTDYDYGTTYFNVSKIVAESLVLGDTVYYDGSKQLETCADGGSDVIANKELLAFPRNNEYLTVYWTPGYDQHERFSSDVHGTYTTVQVTYDAGTTSVEPVFATSGKKLIALVPTLGEQHVWVAFKNTLYECEVAKGYTAPAGKTAYDVLYPMGMDFDVYTEAHNSTRTQWGTDMSTVDEINVHAHAFDWDGNSIYITQFLDGGEAYSTNAEAVYQSDVLDNREHETVSFANTVKKSFTVSGVVTDEDHTPEEIESMVGQHVKYRSPDGGLYDVAVTSLNMTTHNSGYTEVSIDLIQETR